MALSIREITEQNEYKILCDKAVFADKSKGRARPEPECEIRTCFQRDRDRIIHCRAFRRLKHKTQVFLAPSGDHYRTRLTHTLEVSQIARTIARALHLNEDLTEAIALGHDLGHTPFGHAGERALNQLSPNGFKHYEQSVRVVEKLEKNGKGLNLTDEVKNGILCHTSGEDAYTLEGQIIRIADKIAYINHDMVLNVINNSDEKILMDDDFWQLFNELHEFMFVAVYKNPICKSEEVKAVQMIEKLYEYYFKNPDKMPEEYQIIADEEGTDRAVCDYIAGMSDNYSVKIFNQLFVPMFWIE